MGPWPEAAAGREEAIFSSHFLSETGKHFVGGTILGFSSHGLAPHFRYDA
jgi:hypothetical protein